MRFNDLLRRARQPLPAGAGSIPSTLETDERSTRSPNDSGESSAEPKLSNTKLLEAGGSQPGSEQTVFMPAWGSISCSNFWSEAYKTIGSDPDGPKVLAAFGRYVASGKHEAVDEVKKTFAGDTGGSEDTARLKQIQNLAKQKLEKASDARLSFSISGKTVVVRDVVGKVIKAITTFKDLIGAACSTEPHAALAWAGVMVILPLLGDMFQQDEDAAHGLQNIVFLLLRFRELQENVLLPEFRDPGQPEAARQLLLDIRTKVICVYAQVYVYEMHLVLQYAKGRALRALRNAFGADGWKDMWTNIEAMSKQIDQGVQSRVSVRTLETWKAINSVMLKAESIESLQKDTLTAVQDGNQTQLLMRLPCAENAIFDSAEVGSEERCLKGTQRSILNDIQDWVEDPTGPVIFWLHGMAGTGKTSIALTVAHALNNRQSFADGRLPARDSFLAASFFFKQGDATRNSTKTFFSTIARRLAQEFPDLKVHITDAIKNNLEIGTKGPQQQLNDLIVRPLLMLDEQTFVPIRLIIAVDALDECIEKKEVEELVGMLVALENLRQLQLRILVMSRPDDHILRSFRKLSRDLYRSWTLEKIPLPGKQIDRPDDDITLYLRHTLNKIANKRGALPDLIDEVGIAKLSKKADGLFVYAATACRFLDTDDFPDDEARQEMLDQIFDDEMETDDAPQQKVDEIYVKVLSFSRFTKSSKAFIGNILGFIAVFFEPVSVLSLANFLSREKGKLEERLRQLHSVIHIPQEETSPIGLVHLSFRDFLLDEDRSRGLPFHVKETSMHEDVLNRCIDIMSESLHEDMCKLVLPGQLLSEVTPDLIEKSVPQHLRYACRYWVDHLEKLDCDRREAVGLKDDGKIHKFLTEKLLFWLEAMSLIRETSTVILILSRLEESINSATSPVLSALTHDARRFILQYRWVIERAPLQIYCSALIFSPSRSKVRSQFDHLIPSWILKKPQIEGDWTPELCVLEGHTGEIHSVSFSPWDTILASASFDGTIRVWDSRTGTELYQFQEMKGTFLMGRVAFSADGKFIASGLDDDTVRLWEFATGKAFQLVGHSGPVMQVAFSPTNPAILASISPDQTLRIWNIDHRHEIFTLNIPEEHVCDVSFTPNGEFVAVSSGSDMDSEGLVRIWQVENGELHKEFKGHDRMVTHISISMDGKTLASGSEDGTIKLWDVATGYLRQQRDYDYQKHYGCQRDGFPDIRFYPSDGNLVTIRLPDIIELRHVDTWDLITTFDAGGTFVNSFSWDGRFLAAATFDYHIRLCEMTSSGEGFWHKPGGGSVGDVMFLPDNDDVALAINGKAEAELWSSERGTKLATPRLGIVQEVWSSPDERLIALKLNDGTIQVWDKDMTGEINRFDGCDLIFSPDSKRAALRSSGMIRIIDCNIFEESATLRTGSQDREVRFSPGSQAMGWTAISDKHHTTTFHLWDTATNRELISHSFGRQVACRGIKFSPNGELVAFLLQNKQVSAGILLLDVVRGMERVILTPDPQNKDFQSAFHPKSHLLAVATGGNTGNISLWDTASGREIFSVKLDVPQDDVPLRFTGLAISTSGKLVAVFGRELSTRDIHIWDLTDYREIGRLRVDASFWDFSLSPDSSYLELNRSNLSGLRGRVPLLTGTTSEILEASQNCLYMSTQWVIQGIDNLIWIPPIYRHSALASVCWDVKDGSLVFGIRPDLVVFLKLDRTKTPLASRTKGSICK